MKIIDRINEKLEGESTEKDIITISNIISKKVIDLVNIEMNEPKYEFGTFTLDRIKIRKKIYSRIIQNLKTI